MSGASQHSMNLNLDSAMDISITGTLDLQFENGKPKFKLNEPVFSTVNVPLKSLSCDDDETSFVVLGKNSMDFISLASLADYEEIEKKSVAVDYNSIISTLSQEEIESKIAELLQENIKLRETLTRNNRAMKQHFNTLISWQDELMKVHGNHKQKFAETRNLVVSLQQENNDLKTRLAAAGSMADSKFSGELIGELSSRMADDYLSDITNCSLVIAENLNDSFALSSNTSTPTVSMTISRDESVIPSKNHVREDLSQVLIQNMSQEKEQLMHAHSQIISTIEDKVQKIRHCELPSLDFNLDSIANKPDNLGRQEFFKNYTYYNEKLSTLTKCYAEQSAHLANIQECVKRCIGVLEVFEAFEPSNLPAEMWIQYKKTLEQCENQLKQQQQRLQNTSEPQDLIEAHNHFQKIFSDYNSALIELENIREEAIKTAENAKALDNERLSIFAEKMSLEAEKSRLITEENRLRAQQISLNQEKIDLDEHRASLNSQSILYESQIKNLQQHLDESKKYIELKEQMRLKDIELDGIKARLQLARDDAAMNELLQQQLSLWKSDFEEEQKAKNQFKEERDILTNQLRTLRNHNQELLQKINGPNPAPQHVETPDNSLIDPFCAVCGSFKTQGQWHGAGFCQPID